MIISVASGKGVTGKKTVSTSIAAAVELKVIGNTDNFSQLSPQAHSQPFANSILPM